MDILLLQRKVPALLQVEISTGQPAYLMPVRHNPMKAMVDELRGPDLTYMA
jgi:hypothetical protein